MYKQALEGKTELHWHIVKKQNKPKLPQTNNTGRKNHVCEGQSLGGEGLRQSQCLGGGEI